MSPEWSARASLKIRGRILESIRRFFTDRSYLEVETPVRVEIPALELHIDALASEGAYLRTSPEHHMKRLLVEGFERIFELGPCFRSGEIGPRHQTEFTMLEWYRVEADYEAMLGETQSLLVAVACDTVGGPQVMVGDQVVDLEQDWISMSVSEAFLTHAGWDPVEAFDPDRFDIDLVEKVEPKLIQPVPVVLKDFPPALASQARLGGAGAFAERWELYVGGLELANAYSEETDALVLRKRFEACRRARSAAGKTAYAIDESYLDAVSEGLPACSGVALGVDRFVMLLRGEHEISEVRAFSETREVE